MNRLQVGVGLNHWSKKKEVYFLMPLGHLKHISNQGQKQVIDNIWNCFFNNTHLLCLAGYVSSTWNVFTIFKCIHALLISDLLGRSVSTWARQQVYGEVDNTSFSSVFHMQKHNDVSQTIFTVPSVNPLPQKKKKGADITGPVHRNSVWKCS